MSKSYRITKRYMNIGEHKGKTLYNVAPISYGLLTTEDAARQIAAESAATPGDVKAVLDRYAYYVVENLKKGYSIEMLGFGTFHLRFLTQRCVADEKQATNALIKKLVPGFRPSFTMVNGSRLYDLIPDKITLVKSRTKSALSD